MKCCLSILIFLFEFSGVFSAVCSKEDTYGRTLYFNCSIGCCGSIRDRICCDDVNKPRDTSNNISSEATAGIVISAFAFVGIVLIVTICYNKKYGRSTRTMAWREHGAVTLHTTTSSSVQPYPMYNQAYPQRVQTGPRDNVMGSMHPRFY